MRLQPHEEDQLIQSGFSPGPSLKFPDRLCPQPEGSQSESPAFFFAAVTNPTWPYAYFFFAKRLKLFFLVLSSTIPQAARAICRMAFEIGD